MPLNWPQLLARLISLGVSDGWWNLIGFFLFQQMWTHYIRSAGARLLFIRGATIWSWTNTVTESYTQAHGSSTASSTAAGVDTACGVYFFLGRGWGGGWFTTCSVARGRENGRGIRQTVFGRRDVARSVKAGAWCEREHPRHVHTRWCYVIVFTV